MPYQDPEKQRNYKGAWARMRRAGESGTRCGTPVSSEFRLQTAADVRDLLAEQIEAVRSEQNARTLEKARCIGYLASVSLKAIAPGDMATRLQAPESVLKARGRADTEGGR